MQSSAGWLAGPDASIPILEDLAHPQRWVALFAGDGRIAWLSEPLAAWFDASAVRWEDLFARAHRGAELWQELLGQGRLVEREADLLTASGCRPVRISAARLALGDGLVVALLRDESGRLDEIEAERLRHDLASILEPAPTPALGLDRHGVIVCANPAALRVLEQPGDALLGQPLSDCLERAEDVERVAGALAADEARLEGVVLRGRSKRRASLLLRTIRSRGGEAMATVVYLEPRLRSDSLAFLQRKNAELEHALRAVSHDLRSPLVALLGFTRLVREDYGGMLGDKGRHFLQRIEQAAQTMETLIHDLLELSRINPAAVHKTAVDPREVLRQLQAELKPRLDATGTLLELPAEPPLLHCDRTRLYQVLSNLVGNALEHMGPVEAPTIQVSINRVDREHRIVVRDNGRGIGVEHHERIFEIFHSLGPRDDERRQTGVGLAIVKKIAETHGGRVWVESSPDRGAAFHVTLPLPPG